jgi:hypothetical protein
MGCPEAFGEVKWRSLKVTVAGRIAFDSLQKRAGAEQGMLLYRYACCSGKGTKRGARMKERCVVEIFFR